MQNGSSPNRPRTPGASPPQPVPTINLPPIPETGSQKEKNLPPRRSSLGFLRRSRSADKVKGKQTTPPPTVPETPPRIPDLFGNGHASSPAFRSFGGGADQNVSPPRQSTDVQSVVSVARQAGFTMHDPYAKSESMAHRGRYSYASSAISTLNSPRKVRRRKDPTPFNILIIGARNSGKTSFSQFLQHSLALPRRRGNGHIKHLGDVTNEDSDSVDNKSITTHGAFTKTYLETEIDGERIGLTLWDSEGLDKNIVDLQLRETTAFIESKFEETFAEETKVVRAPGVQDTHIHCVFHLLDPSRLDIGIAKAISAGKENDGVVRAGLDEDLDLQAIRSLQGKTIVIPVISKADTCTASHMAQLKALVSSSLSRAGLHPLEALDVDIDSVTPPSSANGHGADSPTLSDTPTGFLPLSIISPDSYEAGTVGRKFPWGFADPFHEDHCDFLKLKEAVFSEWRSELREASRDQWYENWRTSRLSGSGLAVGGGGARRRKL